MRYLRSIVLVVWFPIMLCCGTAAVAQDQQDQQNQDERVIEERIIRYLKEHVKPGERLIVSNLVNNVFKTPEEQKVLGRLFNIVFKIPLFVAQYNSGTNELPTLDEIAAQFNLPVPGEASVLLTILENDPRVPDFIRRDSGTGEIVGVDIELIRKDRHFGKELERTMIGWEGKPIPSFEIDLFDGASLSSSSLQGRNLLVYFWFSGCSPCVRIAPHLVALQREFESKDFSVVAVNADRVLELGTSDADRAAYVRKAGFTFPTGHLNQKMKQDYGNISVYPTLFLVNTDGMVHKHYVNYKPLSALQDDVGTMLQQK